jgi:putative transposase
MAKPHQRTLSRSTLPSSLEARRRHERALLSVIQEAYVHGISTRAVDNLAQALGIKSISNDQVSRICRRSILRSNAFRTRRPHREYPYLFLTPPLRRSGRTAGWSRWRC